jgi:phosphoribosylanthranilate isomerase
MGLAVKICGINSAAAMTAAAAAGADYVGLMFYPPSPRYLAVAEAAALAALVPDGIRRVGVFVDAPANVIEETLEDVALEVLQLHGSETPAVVAAIRARFGLPVIKAIKLAGPGDLAVAQAFEDVADMILFDAKAPPEMIEALPGGNALVFDWRLLAGYRGRRPWLLSGGLTAGNLAEAVAVTGAAIVDVSSGVETAPGVKDPALIAAFVAAARALGRDAGTDH